MQGLRQPEDVRFWQMVEMIPFHECWEWTGATHLFGYGKFRRGAPFNKTVDAHRFSWELNKGPIPVGMSVLHRCDNPACVNPDHLFLGTQYDNVQDCRRKGRDNHCHGEAHYDAKLSASDVIEIRTSTASISKLAKTFGVGETTISNVRARKTWKHVQ